LKKLGKKKGKIAKSPEQIVEPLLEKGKKNQKVKEVKKSPESKVKKASKEASVQ